MSIVDKLTYLQTTKQLLKTEINKINNVLDDNSTFRSYPQELFNGYLDILNNGTDTLWSNLEKVSQTGTEAVLEGVETAPMKMVLNGNTSQETTTGKNLFTTDYLTSNSFTTYTKLTDNSFSFTATGTWKKASYKVPCKPNTNYYFNFSSTSSMYIQIRGVQTGTQIVAVYQAYLTTFNSGENTELQINIDIGQNSIASGTISDIQLEEGTTATSFEKYTGGQPSPSPDYPQQVKVVKGENVVSVSGKNLVDYLDVKGVGSRNGTDNVSANSVSITDNVLTIIKTYSQNGEILKFNNIDLPTINQGENVTISFIPNKTISGVVGIANYNGGGTSNINREVRFVENSIFAITLEALSTYNRLGIFIQGMDESIGIKDLMVELGSTAKPYVPYSKTDYPISLGTIEMCKIGDYKDFPFKAINGDEYYDTLTEEQKNALNYGSWYVHKEIGKYQITGQESTGFYWNNEIKGMRLILDNAIKAIANAPLYCNRFRAVQSVSHDNNYVRLNRTASEAYAGFWFGNISIAGVSGETTFKTYARSNDIILYYPLATPTEEEITNTTLIEQLEAIYKAKSVKDKTYITQTNDDLPFILDVEAIKEYEVN